MGYSLSSQLAKSKSKSTKVEGRKGNCDERDGVGSEKLYLHGRSVESKSFGNGKSKART